MNRLVGKFLCLIGKHDEDTDCNGYSGDEWTTCHRCLKYFKGTLKVWDGHIRRMRHATDEEETEFMGGSK